jgi:hypothetical protein
MIITSLKYFEAYFFLRKNEFFSFHLFLFLDENFYLNLQYLLL